MYTNPPEKKTAFSAPDRVIPVVATTENYFPDVNITPESLVLSSLLLLVVALLLVLLLL